jgi:hypothetical protein
MSPYACKHVFVRKIIFVQTVTNRHTYCMKNSRRGSQTEDFVEPTDLDNEAIMYTAAISISVLQMIMTLTQDT